MEEMKKVEKMKGFLEKMAKVENKERIVNLALTGARTEDVEKISNIDEKLEVYTTFQKLFNRMAKLEDSDLKNFIEVLVASVKFQKILVQFDSLINTDDLENAENMIKDVQNTRNELSKVVVKFLGI